MLLSIFSQCVETHLRPPNERFCVKICFYKAHTCHFRWGLRPSTPQVCLAAKGLSNGSLLSHLVRHIDTDPDPDTQAGRQADRQTDNSTDRLTGRQTWRPLSCGVVCVLWCGCYVSRAEGQPCTPTLHVRCPCAPTFYTHVGVIEHHGDRTRLGANC